MQIENNLSFELNNMKFVWEKLFSHEEIHIFPSNELNRQVYPPLCVQLKKDPLGIIILFINIMNKPNQRATK